MSEIYISERKFVSVTFLVMKRIWVDLFELPHLRGRCRRLLGPGLYNNLRLPSSPVILVFESLAAGPDAFVRLFDARLPSETIWWMRPNTIVDDIDQIAEGKRISSLELSGEPPVSGSVGYEFFATFTATVKDGH